MSRLTMAQRRALPKSDYVFPERAPGHGAYPIPNRSHAVAALRFSKGTKDEAAVRAAVARKFGMGRGK